MDKIILPHQFGAMELKWCSDKYDGIIPLEGHHSVLIYAGKEYNLCCNVEDFNKILDYCIRKDKLDDDLEEEISNLVVNGRLFFEYAYDPDTRIIHELSWESIPFFTYNKKVKLEVEIVSSISLFEGGELTQRKHISFKKILTLNEMSRIECKSTITKTSHKYLKDKLCKEGKYLWVGEHYGKNYNIDSMLEDGYLTEFQLKSIDKGTDSSREFNNSVAIQNIKHKAAKELAKLKPSGGGGGASKEKKIAIGRWMTGGPKEISVAEYIKRGGKIN